MFVCVWCMCVCIGREGEGERKRESVFVCRSGRIKTDNRSCKWRREKQADVFSYSPLNTSVSQSHQKGPPPPLLPFIPPFHALIQTVIKRGTGRFNRQVGETHVEHRIQGWQNNANQVGKTTTTTTRHSTCISTT